MKTLFNKIRRNVILSLNVAIGIGSDSYGQENPELEKYNLENQQVYENFVEFIKEKGDSNRIYVNDMQRVIIRIPKDHLWVYADKEKGECFSDWAFNGMDNHDTYQNENVKKQFIEDMPQEKQLEVAQRYTILLKEIMREARYKNY